MVTSLTLRLSSKVEKDVYPRLDTNLGRLSLSTRVLTRFKHSKYIGVMYEI